MSGPKVGLKKITPEPGIKTLVRDDSAKGLPTDVDREQQTNLPPDSATPRAPDDPKSDGGGGGGRTLPTYEFNTPDNGLPERPRTLPTPGEDYGHPTKFDYNYVTRRDMNASEDGEDESEGKTAYQREWHPGHFQHRQKGLSRIKTRQQYRRNRNKYKMQARIRYKRNKKNPQFKRMQLHRRKYPHMHKRRRASSIRVASMFLAELPSPTTVAERFMEAAREWHPPKSVPPRERQRKQHGDEKLETRHEYMDNRPKHLRDMNQRHKKLMKYKKYKAYKEWYNEQYAAHGDQGFRRIRAEVLTSPQISFGIGRELLPGTVHSVSPMTGLVTFVVDAKDYEPLRSMPIGAFLQVVVFYSEDDIDAFFDLVDVEVGPEAYEDIDANTVRECAAEFDVDTTSKEFADQCMDLVGDFDLEAMTPDQLDQVNQILVLQVLEGGHGRSGIDDEDLEEGDPGEGEEYDWHLYYGEVPEPEPEPVGKVAEGILMYREQESPNQEINYPGDDVGYSPTSPTHHRFQPDEKSGVPSGHEEPSNQSDDVPAGSSRVVPPGDGQLSGIGTRPRTAATMADLARRTGQEVHGKARGVKVRLSRADPRRGIWTFQAMGSEPQPYTIRVKGLRSGNVRDLGKAQVQVSCSCPFFRWQGPEHWAVTNKYLYGRPRGTASNPHIKDPKGKHWACKHVLAALNMARRYRFSSTGLGAFLDAEIVPDYAMPASRVAFRYRKAASEADLAVFKAVLPVYAHLVAESKTMPPRYKGKPGNYFDSPSLPRTGMYQAFTALVRNGREWAEFVIDHKAIPPKKTKAVEMAVRLFSLRREPKDLVKWFEENKQRFDLLVEAERWPDRTEDAGIRTIGSLKVHDTIGASDKDWDKAERIITKAVRAMSKAGLAGFPSMAYGDLFLVGQIGRKNWAAWYMYQKDAIYLRPNIRGISEEESIRHLIHEFGHRYWDKKVPNDQKRAWNTHHMMMTHNRPSGRMPEVGEVLPLEVNRKKVKVQEYKGGRAILVEVGTDAPVGAVSPMKLMDWMAEVEHKGKFPSLYAAKDAEEHFCEALSLKALGRLDGDNLAAFDSIFRG